VRDAERINAAVKDAGLTQIRSSDHHALAQRSFRCHGELAKRIPIGHFVDHGPTVAAHRLDEFLGKTYPELYARRKRTIAKPGDTIAIAGLDWRIVTSAGERSKTALPGAEPPIRPAPATSPKDNDPTQKARNRSAASSRSENSAPASRRSAWNKEFDADCR